MDRFSFSSIFKFLVGILLAQLITVVLVLAGVRMGQQETWIIFSLLVLVTGLLAALWFASIARQARKDAIARVREDFFRQREKIRIRAEREKTKVIKSSHRQIIKETSRVRTKANFKTGAAFLGVMGLGAIMLFTQFVTIGLLTLSTAGGALVGYAVRVRQNYVSNKRKENQRGLSVIKPAGVIETEPASSRRVQKVLPKTQP
jgi:hypothetical protein